MSMTRACTCTSCLLVMSVLKEVKRDSVFVGGQTGDVLG